MAQIIHFIEAKEALEQRKSRKLIQRTLNHMDEIKKAIVNFKRSNLAVVPKPETAE